MHIEIFKQALVEKPFTATQSVSDKWFWHFRAKNGEIVASAEAYTSRSNAIRAAKKCVQNITRVPPGFVFDKLKSHPKKPGVFILGWF